jgi:hypothetical protein
MPAPGGPRNIAVVDVVRTKQSARFEHSDNSIVFVPCQSGELRKGKAG